MKKTLFYILLAMLVNTAFAQHGYELKVNAGGNGSFISNYSGNIIYTRKEASSPWDLGGNNGFSITSYNGDIKTSLKPGFYVDAELYKTLTNGWKISVSAGVNCINYSFDFPINKDSTAKSLIKKDGNTNLLYIQSKLVNVTKQLNKLSLQAGPVFDFLIRKKAYHKVSIYNPEQKAQLAITSDHGDFQKLLFGAHFNTKYQLAMPLELTFGAQYFFNSLYKKEGTYNDMYNKTKPLQLSLGLTYTPVRF